MLKHLLIKNYALIEHLEISPSPGLNMITGETGAGKSIMLGAVGLLLGNRADIKSILNTENKCVVEGQFDVSSYNIKTLFEQEDIDFETNSIFRREITPSGKSRAFVNDTPVTLDVLKRIGLKLMDVHSQHQTLNLGKHVFQLSFVDAFAGTTRDRIAYHKIYQDYSSAKKKLDKLQAEISDIRKEADYNQFLFEELEKADFSVNEQAELEERVAVMENAELIKTQLNTSLQVLSNSEFAAVQSLEEARIALNQLKKFGDHYSILAERLNSNIIELTDIIGELEKEEDVVDFDPQETQIAQERLSLMYQLQQKHAVTDVASLLGIQVDLQTKVQRVTNLDDELAESQKKAEQQFKIVNEKAAALSKKRQKSFRQLEKQLASLLQQVGIPDAEIKIENDTTVPGPTGIDQINILFSANKGVSPQELAKVASGGEFSRLMFCVKYILAEKISLPTIIFDEIDTGVSGEIALKLATMMKKMASNHQLITISHLPQVAAKGDKHYFVYKDNTSDKSISKIKELSSEERLEELAKMIGGDSPSATAFESAKELMG